MWHPHCAVDVVMDEALATAEGTFRPGTGLRQVQRPIVNGPVLSRARDLDDLQAFQNLEHLVANLWWLKHTISSLHYKLEHDVRGSNELHRFPIHLASVIPGS